MRKRCASRSRRSFYVAKIRSTNYIRRVTKRFDMKPKFENLTGSSPVTPLLERERLLEEFITFPDLRKRWGGIHRTNALRILEAAGIKPYRLTNKTVLYKLGEIIAMEAAAYNRLPTNQPKNKAQKAKEALANS